MAHTDSPSGYRMPAEWEPQEAIWLSWPVDSGYWTGKQNQIQVLFAQIAAEISRHEIVRINAPKSLHAAISERLTKADAIIERVELFSHPNNDVWCRDHGPLFVKNGTGQLAITDWEFNGWGGKFEPYDLDNQIPRHIAHSLDLPRIDGGMVLEGGSIEVNSRGQLLTTEAVLLNPNRNPDLSRSEIEAKLSSTLGMQEIFWLGNGIEGDDTDGHVDDLARFIDDTTLVVSWEKNAKRANYRPLHENRDRLQDFRTPEGSNTEVIEIPLPQPCQTQGWRLPVLPASYVNFLILNTAVLVPTFDQRKHDTEALGILGELMPNREIIPIPCLDLVREGGALHCISQQQPALG